MPVVENTSRSNQSRRKTRDQAPTRVPAAPSPRIPTARLRLIRRRSILSARRAPRRLALLGGPLVVGFGSEESAAPCPRLLACPDAARDVVESLDAGPVLRPGQSRCHPDDSGRPIGPLQGKLQLERDLAAEPVGVDGGRWGVDDDLHAVANVGRRLPELTPSRPTLDPPPGHRRPAPDALAQPRVERSVVEPGLKGLHRDSFGPGDEVCGLGRLDEQSYTTTSAGAPM